MKTGIVVMLPLVVCMIFISGCVAASYNPKTFEVKYNRLGDMKVQGIHMKIQEPNKPATTEIDIESTEATGYTATINAMQQAFNTGVIAGKAALVVK